MEVWIRSQYKEILLKTTTVYALGGEISAHGEKGHGLILGQYETKERAVEILDEIHEKLMQQSVGQNIFVYEMPKH